MIQPFAAGLHVDLVDLFAVGGIGEVEMRVFRRSSWPARRLRRLAFSSLLASMTASLRS